MEEISAEQSLQPIHSIAVAGQHNLYVSFKTKIPCNIFEIIKYNVFTVIIRNAIIIKFRLPFAIVTYILEAEVEHVLEISSNTVRQSDFRNTIS